MLYPSEISFRFLQKMKKTLLASCLFISAFHLNAQDSDLGNWFIYFGNYQLSLREGACLLAVFNDEQQTFAGRLIVIH
jgi:hypothetical protein